MSADYNLRRWTALQFIRGTIEEYRLDQCGAVIVDVATRPFTAPVEVRLTAIDFKGLL